MTRLATFAVFLFAVVLSLAPVNVDAQTRVERDAFNRLARTVRAAQSNPSPQRLADVRHDIERAYSVFLVQEQRRDEATKWPADMRPSLWDRAAHLRWMHAAADAMVEAANGLESLTPRFIGFDVRHDATLQRLGSAKLAVSRNQDRVLRHASTCRIHGCVMMVEETNLFDQSLQGLVNAAVAAADGLAFHGRRADAESDTARVPLANIEAPPATTPPVLMALPVAPPPPAVETDPVMMFRTGKMPSCAPCAKRNGRRARFGRRKIRTCIVSAETRRQAACWTFCGTAATTDSGPSMLGGPS